MTSSRRTVEQTTIRIVLLVWISIAVLVAVSGQSDGRLGLRIVAVLVAAIVTVEGARWLAATTGPRPRPLLPMVRVTRPEPSRVPARLQSWVALMRAAEGDPHVAPLLRDRLDELARASGPETEADEVNAITRAVDARRSSAPTLEIGDGG